MLKFEGMREDFLHYLWKYKKCNVLQFKTVNGESIKIVSVGQHNSDAGPDFFNAQLRIDGQLWAGNVEIHIKSSDWYAHNHEIDPNYDNVILHVVWQHDVEVFRKDNSHMPTLVLKNYVEKTAIENYKRLFNRKGQWINCEKDFATVDDFVLKNWLERLYFERLEQKARHIEYLLNNSNNDWEAVLFKMLAKNFGLKVNGEVFYSIANSVEFSKIRKLNKNLLSFEAFLFGQGGLLDADIEDVYFQDLKKEYLFIIQKFQINNAGVLPLQFFRLRPNNFPTIRLSQLARLISSHQNLFSKIIEMSNLEQFYELFEVEVSDYWKSHFTFGKQSRPSSKKISKPFIDLLMINTIIPLKFSYAKHQNKSIDAEIVALINEIPPEKNNIVAKYNSLKVISNSALQSQALLQLKSNYCDKNDCLQCAVGNALLNRN